MKLYVTVLVILFTLCIFGCQQNQKAKEMKNNKVRYGTVTGIKPEKLSYYKELHAAIWPAVAKKIKECNIQNYSIYLKEIDGKFYLFSYFEYVGDNFSVDMQKMATDTATQRWWKETDPTQLPLPDAAAKGEIWSNMEEVFHQD